jgi:hyperosmotically inducible protein
MATVALCASCSSADKNQAKDSVEQIKDKTKEAAEDAAEKTREVVTDATDKGKQVLSKTGEAITDEWITTKVKAKFADEKLLKYEDIQVDTKDRVVTLKGTAATDAEKKRAVTIADGTEGVVRVVDELALKSK